MPAAATKAKTPTAQPKRQAEPDPNEVLIALFAVEKGVGGLFKYQGTKSYFLEHPTTGEIEVFAMKAGTIFAERWKFDQILQIASETEPEILEKNLAILGLGAGFLDELPPYMVTQVISNCWAIDLLEKIFEKAENPKYADAAKARITEIGVLANKPVILNPVDLEI